MMTRITVIALLAPLASAAAAEEIYHDTTDAKLEAHWSCAFDAAMTLVDDDGTPEALARKAVAMCPLQEQELGWRARYVRVWTERRLGGIILAERQVPQMFRGKARSRPTAERPFSQSPPCGDCGSMWRWDDKLRIWRPPGR